MRRREFIGLGASLGIFWAHADAEAAAQSRSSLLKGLAELGYIPGKTLIEERRASEVHESLDTLAAGLIALKVNVLVSQAGGPTAALHRATSTIPFFCWCLSLSKSRGNMSGISQISAFGSKSQGRRSSDDNCQAACSCAMPGSPENIAKTAGWLIQV